ncbi:Ig-like domain-containing protein, partial [Streptococcus suis]
MGSNEDGRRSVELIKETKIRLHKVKKKWLCRVTRLIRKRRLTRDLDGIRISSPSITKGIVSIGALLSGVATEHALTEDVVYASEYTEETALAMADEVVMDTVVSENAGGTLNESQSLESVNTDPPMEKVVEETSEEGPGSSEEVVHNVSEEVMEVINDVSEEAEIVSVRRDTSRLEEVIASIKVALAELVNPGEHIESQAYKDYLSARTHLEEVLKQAEQLLQDKSRTQEELDQAVLEYGQDAINLTRLAEEFRTYSASIGSGFRRLTNQEVITSGTVSLSIPQPVEPMGLSGGQLRANLTFSINDQAKEGDQFTVTLSRTLNLSGSGIPENVKIPDIVVNGKVVATGVWNHDTRTITYTLNSNVDNLKSVRGSINLSVFVDQKEVQGEGSQQFTVTLNGQYQDSQYSNVIYSNPAVNLNGMYSIRAYLTNINLTDGTYDHVIYLNENGRNNSNYNEIVQIVSKGASSFLAATTTIRAYSVPQGQFIDSMEGDFSNYADASSKISSSFGVNGKSLQLNIRGRTTSPLLIVVSSRVDVNSTMNILTETTYANSAMNTGSRWTNENYMFSNAAIARGEYNSTSISLSTSESISTSISESIFESTSESISTSESESIIRSASESVSESVRESVSESVRESVSESISESVRESISESVRESVSESVSESVRESISESLSESVSESISESVSESISESISESVSESISESIS